MSAALVFALCVAAVRPAGERTQHFDADPGWDGHNNRALEPRPRTVRQDFGYSATTRHAGGAAAGEIGGFITPAAEPAYYARKLEPKSFEGSFSASGRLLCRGRRFHALIAFFNPDTANEWRTANTVAIQLLGHGDVFYAFVEYCTAKWRAGGDTPGGFATVRDPATGKAQLKGFPTGVSHAWSIRYDPNGNKGTGIITVTLGGETAVCHLVAGHKDDSATFTHFGLMPVRNR